MTTKLYVGGIPYTSTNDDLKNHFAAAGSVVSAQIIIDKMTNRSKGFGFVEMASDGDADQAIEKLNGSDLNGRNMNVSEARPQEDRPRGGGGGGGGRGGGGYGGGGGGRGGGRGGGGGGGRY